MSGKEEIREGMKMAYRGGGVVCEPDGGELTPTQLPLSHVSAAGELIADPNSMVSSFSVRVDALIVLLRP